MGSTPLTGYPTLQPAYIIKLDVGASNPIGDIASGSTFMHFATPTGSISTVGDFEPKIEADVVYGGDWLHMDPDKSHARINVKGIAKTAEGAGIGFSWEGVCKMDEKIGAIFSGSPEARTNPFGQITTSNKFEVGHPSLKELENNSWVGNGRFVLENGRMQVESRVCKLVASTDEN